MSQTLCSAGAERTMGNYEFMDTETIQDREKDK